MHTWSAVLTLAWLDFLDDGQLVVHQHRRAEVSLECAGLMEGKKNKKQRILSVVSSLPVYRLSCWKGRILAGVTLPHNHHFKLRQYIWLMIQTVFLRKCFECRTFYCIWSEGAIFPALAASYFNLNS